MEQVAIVGLVIDGGVTTRSHSGNILVEVTHLHVGLTVDDLLEGTGKAVRKPYLHVGIEHVGLRRLVGIGSCQTEQTRDALKGLANAA